MDFESYPQIRSADRRSGLGSVDPEMERSDELRERWLDCPKPERLASDGPGFATTMAAHATAVANDQAGYLDPVTGLFVMTAVFLRDRGWCCDIGCRHCPYR